MAKVIQQPIKRNKAETVVDTAIMKLWDVRDLVSEIKGQEYVVLHIELAILGITRKCK